MATILHPATAAMTDLSRIRNFAIIAHIDHGKSTLADRLIQSCGAVAERDMRGQMLDSMDIELAADERERVKQQIEDVIGLDASEAIPISAKTGIGIDDVLEALVKRLPPPKGDAAAPLKALLVDSWYDAYLGVVVLVRVKDGKLAKGLKVRMMATGVTHEIERVGVFTPKNT